MKHEVILSGFGGQGVMSIGKNLVEAGVAEDLQVSWVPLMAQKCVAAQQTVLLFSVMTVLVPRL